MKVINKFKKSEKGSITMMVLASMLFMLVILTASYFAISNESIGQNKKVSQISKQYQVNDDDMEQEFQKVVNSLKVKDYVKVGDYVDYDPTKIDANRTQAVEASKLTYTSPTGTIPTDDTEIITHGNGYVSEEEGGGQTFTAKANDGTETGLKWRVLSVSDDKVELISENPVLKDNTDQDSGKFVLQGGIGYLYAEQELNEVCKIYGYGYGADTSVETEYTVGGPEDTPIIGKIEGSGARSITRDDIDKIAEIYEDKEDEKMKYKDGTIINSSYGDDTNPTTEIYYPTLSSNNITRPGQSTIKKTGFKNTSYKYNKSQIENVNIQNMLFNGLYWTASRVIRTEETRALFYIRMVNTKEVEESDVCSGYTYYLNQFANTYYSVRPIVTLKADVIDLSTKYEKDNVWHLK